LQAFEANLPAGDGNARVAGFAVGPSDSRRRAVGG
jgi:hypothetical protein